MASIGDGGRRGFKITDRGPILACMLRRLALTRTLSRLVHLLRRADSTMEEVRATLRALVADSREVTVSYVVDGWRLVIDGAPLPPAATGCEELVGQLIAHEVRELVIRRFASAAELIKLARLLAEAPCADAPHPSPLEARVAALKLWNVEVTSASATGSSVERAVSSPDHAVVAHHLARVRQATVPLEATMALGELVALASDHAAAGRPEAVAQVLVGLVGAEREASDAVVRDACGQAIERIATPTATRLVAQLLPSLHAGGRTSAYAEHLAACGRCGAAGAAALIAHLMAADSFDERRTFYGAIVELRAGIPLLIGALGHPQWYVVRNAACLLGEMREPLADGALARLLEHTDERVRVAAAAALTRVDTPTARAALQRLLHDPSPELRLHAAGAFAASGTAKIATPLALALDAESDGDVQIGILQALGRLATPDAVQKLVRAALPGPGRARPASYRVAAIEALAAARGAAAMPTLRGLTNDADATVREAARRVVTRAA